MSWEWGPRDDKIQKTLEANNGDFNTRLAFANAKDTPPWLLEIFCLKDTDANVAEAAGLNISSTDEWAQEVLNRFPQIHVEAFWKKRNRRRNLAARLKEIEALEMEGSKMLAGDRDEIIKKHLEDLQHADSHLGASMLTMPPLISYKPTNVEWAPTEKYRVAMVMAPSWGILFPPYNVAKLVGLMRGHGYSVKSYDVNIESYHYLVDTQGQDYWRSERYFLWSIEENFNRFLLPDLMDLFNKTIDDIVMSRPKVIGFSLYNTNIHAAMYMIREIRMVMPDVIIVAGGPEVATSKNHYMYEENLVNYYFLGEAEEQFMHFLENLPTEIESNKVIGDTDSKLNLDIYPYPDYTDYAIQNYKQRGVSIETSRGCVAQCSFCAETYFWKFRSMGPERVVEEMEHQIKLHDVSHFWFVDSLVNGNIKNFKKLVDLINEKDLKIHWNSYARCDGRMDKPFLEAVAKSGCTCLSYGVESGSQKVLDDMRKKIEVWEIENNLRDSHEAGIYNHVNWMVGFPTEQPIDVLHSLQMLANTRKWIHAISPGFTAGPAAASHMDTDWQVYELQWNKEPWDTTFLNNWWTKDYKNTGLHRALRLKINHIWMEIIAQNAPDNVMINSQRYPDIEKMYQLKRRGKDIQDYVKAESHVNFNQFGDSFSASIAREYLPLFFAMWQYFGAGFISVKSDPKIDLPMFGDFLTHNYTAQAKFTIDGNGKYWLEIDHTFKHEPLQEEKTHIYETERARQDMSFTGKFSMRGDIRDWITEEQQAGETIHLQYRNKKKIIPIKVA